MGLYEPIESYLFTRIVKPGMIVFDIRANKVNRSLIFDLATGAFIAKHEVPCSIPRSARS